MFSQQQVRDTSTMTQQAGAKDKLYFNVLEKEVTLKDLDNKVRDFTEARSGLN